LNTFLQRTLILMSLALCGLVAVQWVREVGLRKQLQHQANTQHKQEEVIRDLRAGLLQSEAEVRRLEKLRAGLSAQAISGETETAALRQALKQTEAKVAQLRQHAQAYSHALETANQNISQANGNIQRQNQDLQQMAQERNTAVKRLNELAADYEKVLAELNQAHPGTATNSSQTNPRPRR
jgi:chromosome segregation ATPase